MKLFGFVKPQNAWCITFITFSHETQMNASFSLCGGANYSKTLWTSKKTGGIILNSNNSSQKEVTKKVSFLSHSTHKSFGKNNFSQNQEELCHQIQRKRQNLPCQCLLVGREQFSYWICNNLWKCTKNIPEKLLLAKILYHFYSTDLFNTKTTMPVWVGALLALVIIHHYSPPHRRRVV